MVQTLPLGIPCGWQGDVCAVNRGQAASEVTSLGQFSTQSWTMLAMTLELTVAE